MSAIFNRQKVNIEKYVFKKGLRIWYEKKKRKLDGEIRKGYEQAIQRRWNVNGPRKQKRPLNNQGNTNWNNLHFR